MACREADTSLAGVDRGEGSEGDVSGSIICLRLFSSFVLDYNVNRVSQYEIEIGNQIVEPLSQDFTPLATYVALIKCLLS